MNHRRTLQGRMPISWHRSNLRHAEPASNSLRLLNRERAAATLTRQLARTDIFNISCHSNECPR